MNLSIRKNKETTTDLLQKEKPQNSPYIEARREWEERYGSQVTSRRAWQFISVLSLLVSLVAVIGSLYISSQKEVIPYVVEIDKTGAIIQTSPAIKPNQEIENRIIASELADFISEARNVVLDARQQNDNIFKVYAHLKQQTPAYNKMNDYFRQNDPFERAREITVHCQITSILPLQDTAWEVEWDETVMDRKTGVTITKTRYKLIAYIEIAPPTDETTVMKNPIGLTIKDLNWSKEMEHEKK